MSLKAVKRSTITALESVRADNLRSEKLVVVVLSTCVVLAGL